MRNTMKPTLMLVLSMLFTGLAERPSDASSQPTPIVVHIYKLAGIAPLWHSGIVVDGQEFYFDTNNQVGSIDIEEETMAGMSPHRETLHSCTRSRQEVLDIVTRTISRWNETRYDVASHNCNHFTDDLLKSLGLPGLDREYLDASGLAKAGRQIPGGATIQELLIKWPAHDKQIEAAAKEDLARLQRLPSDTVREANLGLIELEATGQRVGGQISKSWKKAWGL